MTFKSSDLSWIVVSDLKKSIKFFKETLGLKLLSESPEFGWAEFQGVEGGAVIGVSVEDSHNPLKAGQNAVITITVDNLTKVLTDLKAKKVTFVGDVIEIPGHVKMQMIRDLDGNYMQIVEMLAEQPHKKH